MSKLLTEAAVRRLKPTSERRVIRDAAAQSLFLIIQPSGYKSWMMRFRRRGGGSSKIVLGPLDLSGRRPDGEPQVGQPLTLVQARRLAARVNSDRAAGVDVVAQHKDNQRRRLVAEVASNSFAAAVRDFIIEHAKVKTRTWKETSRNLGLDDELLPRPGGLVARWADRDVKTISANDLHSVIEEARKFGIPGLEVRVEKVTESRAHKIHAALSSMFGWLQRRRRVDSNPMIQLAPPPLPDARHRVLSDAEIVKFWAATDAVKVSAGDVLKLLLLTGARRNEITRLRWDEVSADCGTLNLGGERTKNRLPVTIPLPPLARSFIDRQSRSSIYVFAVDSVTPIWVGSKIKKRLDFTMGDVVPWRLHDLRRTAATGMAAIGTPPHVVEAVLNHISGFRSSVAGTYNRHGYLEEKRAALEKWEAYLLALIGDPR